MDITGWINQAKELGVSALAKTSGALGAGVGFVKSRIGPAWFFGSTESSSSYDVNRVDEKHYFLIPFHRADSGYSVYVMRCLPEGVPPINDLPKHRIFHLPNEHALPTLEHMLVADARELVQTEANTPKTFGNRLNDLADQIDQLDGKLFNGVLLVGGLVALINPLAGAAVAMKALVPSIGLLVSKFGLRYAGETASAYELTSRIRAAENDVLRQFRNAGTDSLVNPLLAQLDRALKTSERQYDPILDFDLDELDVGTQDRARLLKLTRQAVTNTYNDIIDTPATWKEAHLGPEDIRYLELIRDLARQERQH